MQSMRIKVFLVLVVIILIYPSSLIAQPPAQPKTPKTNTLQSEPAEASPRLNAATEQRIALVIGNSAYSSGPLKNPVNDAEAMAAALQKLGFKVTLKKNANLETMEEAIEDFGNWLKRGGVGLFYYAGHGVQVSGINYLIPVDAKVNKESDVRYKALDVGRILDEMANANNGMNIVLLDACRDNPFGKSFRSASRGLAIVSNSPSGTFISYSTSPGQVASDGEGKNSPYTRALLENISKPGLTIYDVFMNVRSKVKKETGQVPWELSSLEGRFFFVPGNGKMITDKAEAVASKTSPTDELEKELLEQKKALAEEKQKLEEERKQLVMGNRPAVSTANEIKRDGQFIAYDNGTVLDTSTNLMWAVKDNGSNINWQGAKNYCENYRGGGYSDWRLPTQDELAGLYDKSKGYTPVCAASGDNDKVHLTNLITLSCWWGWASDTRGSEAATFIFNLGYRTWYRQSYDGGLRSLPVRSGK